MPTKVERAQHILDKYARTEALKQMRLVLARAMRDPEMPLRMDFRPEGSRTTVTLWAKPIAPLA